METFVAQLVEKVGLSEDQARKVVAFVQEHWTEIPTWLGNGGIKNALADKLPAGLGGLLG